MSRDDVIIHKEELTTRLVSLSIKMRHTPASQRHRMDLFVILAMPQLRSRLELFVELLVQEKQLSFVHQLLQKKVLLHSVIREKPYWEEGVEM